MESSEQVSLLLCIYVPRTMDCTQFALDDFKILEEIRTVRSDIATIDRYSYSGVTRIAVLGYGS